MPNGIASKELINPIIPAMKAKSIVIGIKGIIKIFAGIETKERIPVL